MNDITITASEQAQALVGRHYRMTEHYEVGREKIREFARAVQEQHPAHWHEEAAAELGYDGLLAPMTFTSIMLMLMQRKMFESVLTAYDIGQVLQTEQAIQVHRPVLAGDRLECVSYIESFRQFGDKDFMVTKNVLTNQHKELLQTATSTAVAQTGVAIATELRSAVEGVIMTGQSGADRLDAAARRASLGEESGIVECFDEPPVADPRDRARTPHTVPRFEDLAVGLELPPRAVLLSRGDLVNYAGVSGDSNPIHFSDEVARSAGLPDVVAHGLLTMGLGAGYLTSWLGDPAAVTGYGVRFAGFAPVAATKASVLEFRGKIKDLDAARRTATVALTATCDGRKLFGRATADVALR
ncbi:putative beta-hydroxyacyl-[acyl-carrier-protein] dehydratase [Nocardia brasiliensis NBRC 14402]|uniref:fused (3R)-hydroxyacyl-ACP dehydratase subunits HadA/HadB n=1 Tax=Nocardia brasiliensis TaxID=37326 RepID=UPI0003119B22|nr:fused (3R)-hydroxyacyl-ACP dehydratase subunits HadA/HadB [Nocardia brasiliensis]ASF07631.1 (R)-hydratase [Nocardia brasiliensis]GAJ81052.1 putative beta-hydroxyacyl-[acyl-carrier-protein] dehydratase [Nocardia brasiliensis NBRC 14402]SUB54826.1 (3R)-hydroxyacyl-ACP dehydratase subunit HadB [Nocardia brasiliensis]